MRRLLGIILFFPFAGLAAGETDTAKELIDENSVAVCSSTSPANPTVSEYFSGLMTTEHWPARWTCGEWSRSEGWLYIISDLVVFAAYLSIPIILFFYLWKKDLGVFKTITLAFGVFILACGITHLVDAIIFWEPIYRFSGFTRMITALVSVATVGLMIRKAPIVLTYRSPETLQREVNKAVAQAAELNETLRESSEIARIGHWELDVKTREVVWSDSMYEIFEMEPDTPINQSTALNYYPGHEELIQSHVQRALETHEKYDVDVRIITERGNRLWIRATGIPVVVNGQVVKLRGYALDIDRRKKLELERERSRELLEKEVSERTRELKVINQELESFSYYISHDLRAPLRAINGFSEALIEDYMPNLDETATRYLDRISYNSKKMGDLIDDILAFSRMTRKKAAFKTFNLHEMVTRIIDDFFIESRQHIKVGFLPEIYGDPEMVQQVIANLISNAVKYSAKEEKPCIEIEGEESEDTCLIKVSDNGVGFNVKYSENLFKVFHRLHTDEEFEGTGVGLALCKKIMDAHEGDIWAKSTVGEGSVFYIRFKKATTL